MKEVTREEIIECLCDVVNQACAIGDEPDEMLLDSGFLSAYADALLLLEKLGKVKIINRGGRGVRAKWIKED